MIYTVTIDFYGIRKMRCDSTNVHEHLPHFWYNPDMFRRYFCKGD